MEGKPPHDKGIVCGDCGYFLGWKKKQKNIDKEINLGKQYKDTGGGCSICGGDPAINVEGTLWMCGECVQENIHV